MFDPIRVLTYNTKTQKGACSFITPTDDPERSIRATTDQNGNPELSMTLLLPTKGANKGNEQRTSLHIPVSTLKSLVAYAEHAAKKTSAVNAIFSSPKNANDVLPPPAKKNEVKETATAAK